MLMKNTQMSTIIFLLKKKQMKKRGCSYLIKQAFNSSHDYIKKTIPHFQSPYVKHEIKIWL